MPFPLPPLFSCLSNSKSTAQNPPKILIIRALARDSQLYTLVSEYVVIEIAARREHHALLSFWSSMTIAVIISLKERSTSEEIISEKVLPYLAPVISSKQSAEAQIASYMILIVLVSQCSLDRSVIIAIIQSITRRWSKKSQRSGLAAITQALQYLDIETYEPLDEEVWSAIGKVEDLMQELDNLQRKIQVGKFLVSYALSILKFSPTEVDVCFSIIQNQALSEAQKGLVMEQVIQTALGRLNPESQHVFASALQSTAQNEALFQMLLATLKKLDLDLDQLELQLQASLQPLDIVNTKELTETSKDEVSETPRSIIEIINNLLKINRPSFLTKEAAQDFFYVKDIFLKILASNDKLLFTFVKSTRAFVSDESRVTFLMRIWITDNIPILARLAALQLFKISISDMPASNDIQASIVYLLVILSNPSQKLRSTAAECLTLLTERYFSTSKREQILGLETLYGVGPETTQLKWLGTKDIQAFLKDAVCAHLEECVLDPEYVNVVVSRVVDISILAQEKKKKEISYKGSVLAFLASHVNGCGLQSVKLALLEMIVDCNRPAVPVATLCSGILKYWLSDRESIMADCREDGVSFVSLERSVLKMINPGDKEAVHFLLSAVKVGITGITDLACARIVELWDKWKCDTQVTIGRTLLDVALDDDSEFDAIDALGKLNISVQMYSALLNDAKFEIDQQEESQSQTTKRRRRSSNSRQMHVGQMMSMMEKKLKKLTIVLELLEAEENIQNGQELLKQLFDTLGDLLVLKTDTALPVQYLQQVLVGSMLPIVNNMSVRFVILSWFCQTSN